MNIYSESSVRVVLNLMVKITKRRQKNVFFLIPYSIIKKSIKSIFGNFLFTRSPYSFLANCAESYIILHEEVRKAVDNNSRR